MYKQGTEALVVVGLVLLDMVDMFEVVVELLEAQVHHNSGKCHHSQQNIQLGMRGHLDNY